MILSYSRGKTGKAACCCVHLILLRWLSSHALIVDMIWKVLFPSVLSWWWMHTEVWFRVLKHFTHPPASTGKSLARDLLLAELMRYDGPLAPLEDLYFPVLQWHSSLFNFILSHVTWAHLTYHLTALASSPLFFFLRSLSCCEFKPTVFSAGGLMWVMWCNEQMPAVPDTKNGGMLNQSTHS